MTISRSCRSAPRRARGFSLVEMMVALVAGLIVSAAVITFVMASFRSNGEFVVSTRLTQELRNSLDLITRDLRRSGYNEDAMGLAATGASSPFSKILVSGECVVYAYDRVGGNIGVIDVDNGEVRAVRRSVVTFNGQQVGVIEYAESSAGVKPSCTGATATYSNFPPTCNATTKWCALSDPSLINITALTFADSTADVGSSITLREIGVTVAGQMADSTLFTRSVTSNVRVRSDCYEPTGFDCTSSP